VPTDDEVFAWMQTEVATFLEVDPAAVTRDTNFFDDLEADSIDLVEVVTLIERQYDLEIDDQHLYDIETVGELIDLVVVLSNRET
jgi:acyl carrier protein